jgi:hypothetical protein
MPIPSKFKATMKVTLTFTLESDRSAYYIRHARDRVAQHVKLAGGGIPAFACKVTSTKTIGKLSWNNL